MANAAMNNKMPSNSGSPPAPEWNIHPTAPKASTCVARPVNNNGRRPARSTSAIATRVNPTFTRPIMTEDWNASLMPTPAVVKIFVE